MKGCLLRVLLLPFIIGVIYPLLLLRYPFPSIVFPAEGAEATAVIAGLFLWLGMISFLDVKRYASDRALINKDYGFLRDGEKTIVSGIIKSKAPFLKAPFSGQECIGYRYKVSRLARSAGSTSTSTRWTYYEGCALLSAVIKCPLGNVKILAEPDIELFYEVPVLKLIDEVEQAENYLRSCSFGEEVKGPGDFRVDKKIGDPKELEECDLEEGIIKQGETVLVSGIYSSAQGGIRADPDSIMRPFHIVPEGAKALKNKTRNRLITVAICLGISSVVIAIYFLKFGKPITW